jgi:hypothetical protein
VIGAFSCCIGAMLVVAPQEPIVATIQLPDGLAVTRTLLVDVDGDGWRDLVLACREQKGGRRSLRVHLRQAGEPAFVSRPSRPPDEIDRDVVAFTFCDCTPAAGAELILLTAEQVVLATRGDDGAPAYTRLAHHDLVWPAADPDGVVPLPGAAVDFDRDGHIDLLLPAPDGWTVLFQERDAGAAGIARFERRVEHTLPPFRGAFERDGAGAGLRAGDSSFELRFSAGGSGDRPRGALVRTSTRTPPCAVLDLDGNGTLDLVTLRNGRQYRACQSAPRQLTPSDRALPLPPDRLKLFDPAFDMQCDDVDGDGRADLLLATSTRRDDDVEARVDLFLAREDGWWPDEPTSRLRLQPLAGPPRLVDVDGDGRRDLGCV